MFPIPAGKRPRPGGGTGAEAGNRLAQAAEAPGDGILKEGDAAGAEGKVEEEEQE